MRKFCFSNYLCCHHNFLKICFLPFTVKKEIKCSRDSEILYSTVLHNKIVRDTALENQKAISNYNYFVKFLGIPDTLYFLSNSV